MPKILVADDEEDQEDQLAHVGEAIGLKERLQPALEPHGRQEGEAHQVEDREAQDEGAVGRLGRTRTGGQ